MYIVKQMPEFTGWLGGIKDSTTRIRLGMRLDKAQRGLLGDVKPVGDGVLIVMLGGGDKSSQQSDIESAIALSKTLLKESEDDPEN